MEIKNNSWLSLIERLHGAELYMDLFNSSYGVWRKKNNSWLSLVERLHGAELWIRFSVRGLEKKMIVGYPW